MKRQMRFRGWMLTLLLCALVSASVYGQEADSEVLDCPEGETCIFLSTNTPPDFESFTKEGDLLTFRGWEGELVRIVHEGTLLYAETVVFHSEDNWAKLDGAVRVLRDDVIITATKAELQFDDDRFHFENDVYLHMTGDQEIEVWADVLEYDAGTDDIIAQGNVELRETDRTATAERLEYEKVADRLVLSGTVKVIEERSESTFDRFVINLDDSNFVGYGAGRIILRDL